MSEKLPTLLDISPSNCLDLDERCAVENFLGRTLNEAEELFGDKPHYYTEDLLWMGDVGFVFYFPAFYNFLKSDKANGDCDVLNNIITIIESRAENFADSIRPIKGTVLSCVDYCLTDFAKFQVDAEIYGDLESRLRELKKRVSEL